MGPARFIANDNAQNRRAGLHLTASICISGCLFDLRGIIAGGASPVTAGSLRHDSVIHASASTAAPVEAVHITCTSSLGLLYGSYVKMRRKDCNCT
jgi:hypothetical protein